MSFDLSHTAFAAAAQLAKEHGVTTPWLHPDNAFKQGWRSMIQHYYSIPAEDAKGHSMPASHATVCTLPFVDAMAFDIQRAREKVCHRDAPLVVAMRPKTFCVVHRAWKCRKPGHQAAGRAGDRGWLRVASCCDLRRDHDNPMTRRLLRARPATCM